MRHRGSGGTGFPVSGCSGGIRNAPAGTGAGCSVGWEGGAGDGGWGAGFSGVSGFVGPGMQVVSLVRVGAKNGFFRKYVRPRFHAPCFQYVAGLVFMFFPPTIGGSWTAVFGCWEAIVSVACRLE